MIALCAALSKEKTMPSLEQSLQEVITYLEFLAEEDVKNDTHSASMISTLEYLRKIFYEL